MSKPLLPLHRDSSDKRWGPAPPGYVPGRGRGATGFVGGVSRDEVDRDDENNTDLSEANFDSFSGYGGSLFSRGTFDKDDDEADMLYNHVSRMIFNLVKKH